MRTNGARHSPLKAVQSLDFGVRVPPARFPSVYRVASRYASIITPPRDFPHYFQMFGKYVRPLRNVASKMEAIQSLDDAKSWLDDSTRRDFDPGSATMWLSRLSDKVEYLSGMGKNLDLFQAEHRGTQKVLGWAAGAAQEAREYANYLERETKKIRDNKANLDENLDYYKDYVPRDLVEAVYWFNSKEWLNFYKMLVEAPDRLNAHLNIRNRPNTGKVETLYHASVDAQSLLRSGFNPQGKGGMGLGGSTDTDAGLPAISFTFDFYIAKEIARALKEGVLIAQGEVNPSEVLAWADKAGFKDDVVETAHINYFSQAVWEDPSKRVEHAMAYWYAYIAFAGRAGERYNPVFWTGPERLIPLFKRVKYGDIGVLVADVNMADPELTYVPAEREYRVPVSAIVDLKRVI